MIIDFYLMHKDSDMKPTEIFSDNLLELEKVCKKALINGDIVALHLSNSVLEPSSVFELSVMIAEDMVKKFNANNIIVR